MSTLGALKARIADELGGREDLMSQIGLAVADAILLLRRRRFDWTEGRPTAATTAGEEFLAWPVDLLELDRATLLVGTTPWTLTPRTRGVVEEWAVPPASGTGQPTDYALHQRRLRLYPIPDATYTIVFEGLVEVAPALAGDASSNAWTTPGQGEMLVRQLAKAIVCMDVIRDMESARTFAALVGLTPADLARGATPKRHVGRIRGRW